MLPMLTLLIYVEGPLNHNGVLTARNTLAPLLSVLLSHGIRIPLFAVKSANGNKITCRQGVQAIIILILRIGIKQKLKRPQYRY